MLLEKVRCSHPYCVSIPLYRFGREEGALGSVIHWDERTVEIDQSQGEYVTRVVRHLQHSFAVIGSDRRCKALTSSFATILNSYEPNELPEHTYTEQDWNPLTMEDDLKDIQLIQSKQALRRESRLGIHGEGEASILTHDNLPNIRVQTGHSANLRLRPAQYFQYADLRLHSRQLLRQDS